MRDVRDWTILHGDAPVDDIVAVLDDLAAHPVQKRAMFAHAALPYSEHRVARVRVAAVRALAGVLGVDGLRAIATRLDDGDAGVRAAAVDALAASCVHDGSHFVCALFHRRIAVRRAALTLCASDKPPVRVPLAHAVMLLADPAHASDVRALLDKRAHEGAAALALLAARRHKLLHDTELLERLARVPFAARAAEVLPQMPYPAVVDTHVATAENLRTYLTALVHTDPLADALALLWRAPALSDDAPIVGQLIEARKKNQLRDPEHRRFAVCCAQVMLTHGTSSPRMLALCALAVPSLILLETDLARRRAALHALVDVAGADLVGKGTSLKLLHDKGALHAAAKDADGDATALDARAIAGAMRLMFDAPYQKLRDVIPTNDVVKAFWRAPLASLSLLWAAPRSPADREAYRALVRAVVLALPAAKTAAGGSADVVAALCVTLPAEGGFAVEDVDKTHPGLAERALALLLADTRASLAEVDARRLERNAAVLTAQLGAAATSKMVIAAARVPEAVRDIAPVAALTADAILRAAPKAHLANTVAHLDVTALTALLARLRACVFPVDVERAWAHVLASHGDADARAWALPRLGVADAPRAIAVGLGEHLARCPAADVPLVASVFLHQPLTGLTDALAARASSKPVRETPRSARLAAAILASHDPPAAVAEAFQAAISEAPPFLSAVDHALLDADTRSDLPLLATAWIHHDAGQSVRFEHHCRTAPGGLRAVVDLALALPSPLLSWKLMRALVEVVRVWTYQRKVLLEKLDDRLAEVIVAILARTVEPRPPVAPETSAFNHARALRRLAAELLALAHGGGKAASFVDDVRARLLDKKPELEPDVRELLRSVATWPAPVPAPAPLDVAGARLTSLETHVVRAAVDELTKAGPAGLRAIVDALAARPAPACLKVIIERAIFDDEAAAALLRDEIEPEVRFRVALRLDDHKAALEAACAPATREWLTPDDMTALAARVPSRALALKLARSPHAPAYTKSAWTLLSLFHDENAARDAASPREVRTVRDAARTSGTDGDALDVRDGRDDERAPSDVERALYAFLDADDAREPALRAEVAAALIGAGDARTVVARIAPLVVACALNAPEPRHEALLRRSVPNGLWLEIIASAAVAGDGTLDGALENLMQHRLVDDDVAATVALHLLKRGVDEDDARPLFAVLRRARWFDDPRVEDLRDAVQWGIRQARSLLGKPVGVEFIHDVLGYTRLHQPRIYINPMPLLRGERGGDDVVRGLMVHEIGHHLYHADAIGKQCWADAQKEGIAGLLNLVADEHLERNLRAISDTYGDHLKVLASYAFQHTARDVWVDALFGYLGRHVATVLTRVPLLPARKWGCIHVELGRLLAEISTHTSFARFMRALRQGLGARQGDDKVKTALGLFEKKAFRASKMDWLLEIARELKRIFGDEVKILETFGLHETMEASESDLNEEGFSPDELQRQLDKKGGRKNAPIEKPRFNDGPDERFDLIDQVVPLAHEPVSHRQVADQGRRATKALKSVFDELGTKIVVEHRRMSGRSLDRQGLTSAIVKLDPRLLVRRKPVPAADLFVGIVVDCSGSMAGEHSMDKARVFATSLAEAARGHKGVDVRVFGFTDTVIYDAGDAERCAAHALSAGGGNNDAAGLWHAAVAAKRSRRAKRLLVMVSDGLPTECSASSLRALSSRLERTGMLTAQVAVRPISERCFKHYVEILGDDVDDAARRFARVVGKLVRQTVGAR